VTRPDAGQRVAIIGGGLIGLCAAYYLDRQHCQVTILEKEAIGSGASRGNGGQVVPADPLPAPGMVTEGLRHWFSPSSAFYVNPRSLVSLLPFLVSFSLHANKSAYLSAFRKLDELNRLTAELFDELAAAGIGTDLARTGNLKAFRERDTAFAEWSAARRLAGLGLVGEPGEFLNRSALRELEPSLGEAACWGFLRPDVRWGDPSIFVDQLSGHLENRGVAIDEPFSVDAITERPGSVVVSSSGGDEREYDSVLIAAGTRSRELVRGLGQRIALVPGRGYSFTVLPERMPGYTVLLGEAHVGATPLDGTRLRIAGTMEFGAPAGVPGQGAADGAGTRAGRGPGAGRGPYAARIEAIARAARPFLGGVDWDKHSDEWAASRPMTPDGLPYIGRVGRSPRVFLATGHNMLGFSLAPATGQRIAALMTGAIDDTALKSFAPGR
jgi:D-amino-acid dehydrogenase